MTKARCRLVDTSVSRWYHCLSRCCRKAHLLSDENGFQRKDWIDQRLKELNQIFAISVGGFSTMDNHLHLLLRIDCEEAENWSDQEIVERWFRLYPPRGADRKPMKPSEEMIQAKLNNTDWVRETRSRLSSLGWFMKCLKEPLARLANKQDGCTGAFFEGRFKSIAILDQESLLSVAAYIDLNPVAAGIVALPEQSPHTSIKERVDNAVVQGRMEDVEQIRNGSVAAQAVSGDIEDSLWLVPIEDRQRQGSLRKGIVEGFTLGQYLLLVDYTSRVVRKGKAVVQSELEGIFERLQSSAEIWSQRIKRLHEKTWVGRFLSASRDRLRELASKLGVRHLANIG
jgi:hypothetical protein